MPRMACGIPELAITKVPRQICDAPVGMTHMCSTESITFQFALRCICGLITTD